MSTSEGQGPHNSITSWDGYYYPEKPAFITSYADALGCGPSETYPTPMDGVDNWNWVIRSGCNGGGEIVHCNANYGHDYPFSQRFSKTFEFLSYLLNL